MRKTLDEQAPRDWFHAQLNIQRAWATKKHPAVADPRNWRPPHAVSPRQRRGIVRAIWQPWKYCVPLGATRNLKTVHTGFNGETRQMKCQQISLEHTAGEGEMINMFWEILYNFSGPESLMPLHDAIMRLPTIWQYCQYKLTRNLHKHHTGRIYWNTLLQSGLSCTELPFFTTRDIFDSDKKRSDRGGRDYFMVLELLRGCIPGPGIKEQENPPLRLRGAKVVCCRMVVRDPEGSVDLYVVHTITHHAVTVQRIKNGRQKRFEA